MDEDGKRGIAIGEAARRAGTSVHTLRYYDRAGVLRPASRTSSGRRRYSEEDLDFPALLRYLREAGMPLDRIACYMKLERQGNATLPERLGMLRDLHQAVREEVGRLSPRS